jgi:transcriptional regulator with XRE-family HTH domain
MAHAASPTLGSYLRELRQTRALTLASAARSAGIGRVTLTRWETGGQQPRLPELEALLRALGASPTEHGHALARMDAPRARNERLAAARRIAERVEIGPMPHGGDLLRALRHREGLSLEAAAIRLRVNARTLRRWENGEVWPSADQLEVTCALLGAQPQEATALTSGRFVPGASPREVPLDELAARYDVQREMPVHTPCGDLGWITLAAQIWPHAARGAAGRELLAAVYSDHGDRLAMVSRWSEVRRYSGRALELRPPGPAPRPYSLIAAINFAHAAVHGGPRPAPRSGLELLQLWSSAPKEPVFDAWIQSRMAEYLALDGRVEESLEWSARACRVAAEDPSPREVLLRRVDYAARLIGAGRYEEGLAELDVEVPDPVTRTRVAIDRAKVFVALRQPSSAHDWLDQARREIEAYHIDHLRQEADTLARGF